MSTIKVPRTWAHLRVIGIAMRALCAGSEAETAELLSKYRGQSPEADKLLDSAIVYVRTFFPKSKSLPKSGSAIDPIALFGDKFEAFASQVKSGARANGPAGHLALCDLSNPSLNIKDSFSLVIAFVHSCILTNPNSNFTISCISNSSSDSAATGASSTTATANSTSAFDSATGWPEMFPPDAIAASGDASFAYHVVYNSSNSAPSGELQLRCTKMGGTLMLIGLVTINSTGAKNDSKELEPITVQIKVADFVSSNATSDAIAECLQSLHPNNQGLGQFLPRAAATELSNRITNELLNPTFNAIFPDHNNFNAIANANSTSTGNGNQNSNNRSRFNDPFQGRDEDYDNPLRVGGNRNPLIDPRHYGDGDLFPANVGRNPAFGGIGGIGGNLGGTGGGLLGPGHPNFPSIGGNRLPRPGGVPPAARYDPIHGGPPRRGGNGGAPNRPGIGGNAGGNFGGNAGGNLGGRGGGAGRGGRGFDFNPDIDFPPPDDDDDNDRFGLYG